MGRGGARVGAGRRPKPIHAHLLAGTFRKSRHAGAAAVAGLSPPVAPPDWHPTPADRAALGPRAELWLTAILQIYQPNVLQGLAIMEAMWSMTRIQMLESGGPSVSLTREHKLFLAQWSALQLER